MKKTMMILTLSAVLLAVSACSGQRGRIGGEKVCTNDYLLGVISIAEMVDPCGK